MAALAPPVLAARTAETPRIFVVAATGTGSACTTKQPCSLETAQLAVRRLAPAMGSNLDVVLSGGTYRLTHPFRLTAADSGRNGYRVIYRAAAGATPLLSGGREITGWRPVPGMSHVWSAQLPASVDTRQLYVNGRRLPIASGLPRATTLLQTPTGLLASSMAMARWPDPRNIAVAFKGGNGPWTETFCNIAAIHGRAITMAQPCWDNLHLKALGVQELAWFDDPMGGFGGLALWKTPTALQNAVPLLSPHHWAIDRTTHTIYYAPATGHAPAEQSIVAPALQTLISVIGSHNVTLQGLTFAYAGWTAPDSNDGFPQMQADWYLHGRHANSMEGTCQFSIPRGSCPFASWTRTPANVVLRSTRNVELEGNTFTHLGGVGLDMYDGAHGDLIKGNEFTDISASAIQLGSTDDPLPGTRGVLESHNTLVDNYIHQVAIQYLGGVGIWLGYTQYSRVVHNQVDHVPYTGISVGWGGWHANVVNNNDPNLNAHNVVADNLLFDYMTKLGDGGAIYTNGSQAASWPAALQIRGNVAYNGVNTDFSLYTDAASQYVLISRNFVYFQPFDSFNSGGCRTVGHIRLYDNVFAPGGPAYPCFAYVDINHWRNATVCENPPPDQTPQAIVAHAGLEPAFRYLLRSRRPAVNLVAPTSISSQGDQVVISGSGFGPDTEVRFGELPATSVRVLSANYLLARAPRGSGEVNVTVSTAAGASRASKATRVVYSAHPAACVNDLGTGFTTGLLS